MGTPARHASFAYGANGFISTITDTAGRSMAFTYNADNRIESVVDADNKTTRYTYVADDALGVDAACSAALPAGTGWRIKTITYPGKPDPTENVYSPSRRIVRQVAAGGEETRFSYKVAGACVTHIAKPGVVCTGAACPTEDNWDNYQAGWRIHGGRVVATTTRDASGNTRTARFGSKGEVVEMIDGSGQSTLYKRDSDGRIVSRTDPLGRVTTYRYDANGNKSMIIDPLQRITRMTYDGKWNALTSTTRYNDPSPSGQANPQTSSMQYDTATGILKSATSPLGFTTTFAYTAEGLLAKVTTPKNFTMAMHYTAQGDLQKSLDPLQNETQFEHDAAGRTVKVIDPRGYSTAIQYNGVDQTTEIIDALAGKTRLDYDASQRLKSVTNPLDKTIQSNTYDDGGRLKTQANALNQATQYTYDNAGRVSAVTDAAGKVTTLGYDSAGRLATITRPEGTQTLNYDAVNRLIRSTEPDGTLEYEYDAVDRITRHVQTTGTRTTTIDYTYDPLDRLVKRVIASTDVGGLTLPPDTTEYQYDNDDRLVRLVYRGDGSKNDVTAYTWDEDSRLQRKVLPNGIQVAYQYDAASRLEQIEYTTSSNVVLDRIRYTYNANGQIVQRESLNAIAKDERPTTAVYNAANQMTAITLYPGTANQVSYLLSYDENGNLAKKQSSQSPSDLTTYQWDSRNRLTAINAPGILASFGYDAAGRRTRKTINGQTTTYLYDGDQAIGEIQSGSAGSTLSINLTGLNLDEAIARYTQTANGTRQGSTYLTDLLGSVIAQSNADQTIGSRYAYSAYGEVAGQGDEAQNPTQYTARENDRTGLYFYRARYYDPVLKRFIQSDPIGLEGGLNTYLYANAAPTMYTDPLGLKTVQCTKPLNALKESFGSGFGGFAHDWLPALYHQYSCVVDKSGKVTCGGQDRGENGAGKPSKDVMDPPGGQCEEIEPDNNCFEQCMITEWGKPRPAYGIPLGTDCQEYDDDVIKRCRKQCNIKKSWWK